MYMETYYDDNFKEVENVDQISSEIGEFLAEFTRYLRRILRNLEKSIDKMNRHKMTVINNICLKRKFITG